MIESYDRVRRFICSENFSDRKVLIRQKNVPVTEFLEKLSKGSINHYFFVPQDAYLGNNIRNNGLMVDLQEIGIMTLNDANLLYTPGIDYRILPDRKCEKERLIRTYWLEGEGDFVEIEGHIRSPWCELLMQRFSNDFLRIGVDGATKKDHKELAELIGEG